MLKRIIKWIFIGVVLAGFLLNFGLEHLECIPIDGSIFNLKDFERRENIIDALAYIQTYSPEDYERVCNLAKKIELTDFEKQIVTEVSSHAKGAYYPNAKDTTLPGVIKIDRDAALSHKSQLEMILVHEACHAYQIKNFADWSEAPCEDKGHQYLYSLRPPDTIEHISEELITQTGYKFHTYCRLKASESKEGECIFINNTLENEKMCAKVFLKKDGLEQNPKNVCAEVEAVDHKTAPFILEEKVDFYQFGFSPELVR